MDFAKCPLDILDISSLHETIAKQKNSD